MDERDPMMDTWEDTRPIPLDEPPPIIRKYETGAINGAPITRAAASGLIESRPMDENEDTRTETTRKLFRSYSLTAMAMAAVVVVVVVLLVRWIAS